MKTKRLLYLQAFFMMFVVSAISQTIAPGDTLKINFQPTPGTQPGTSDAVAPAVPAGYVGDFGLVYANRGGSYSYGWDSDISANARQRSAATGPTYNTIQFQSGTTRLWKITLDPGKYNVKIVAGDYYNTDSKNEFLLSNGSTLTDATPKTSNFDTYYTSITVAGDGILSFTGTTLSNNAKVCYIWISRDIAPVAAQATSVTGTSFTANWGAVSGAASYQLDVSKTSTFSDALLSESFAKITTNYSNNKTASMDAITQTPGWASDKCYDSEVGNARIGEGGASGYLTTPTIDLSSEGGNAVLTFDIKKYLTDVNTTCRVYHAADGTTFTQVGSDITYTDAFTTKTVAITGGTANSKIKISGIGLGSNRFHLDNISVRHSNLSGYDNLSVAGTSQAVSGLSAGTGYYYRVRSVFGGIGYTNSGTITTITDVAGSTNTSSLPTCSTCDLEVATGGTLTVDATKTLKNIIVNGGAKITVATGQTLALTNLTLKSDATNGTATIKPEGTGALTVTNSPIVEQYLTTSRNWFISSPVSGATSNVFSAASSATNKLYWYNEAQGSSPTLNWPQITDNTTSLIVTRGYVANMPADGAVTFTGGSLNTGNITAGLNSLPALSRTAGQTKEGFNLVGNPYPSYLDWSAVIAPAAGNSGIGTSFWYRTKNTSNAYIFVTHNGTSGYTIPAAQTPNTTYSKFIPPMQAFWVRVNENVEKTTHTATIAFTNDMRSHLDDTGNKLKAPKNDDRQRLRLQLANGTASDEALIYFDAAAANGFDNYDSPKFMNNSEVMPDLYTKAGNEKLVINGLNNVTDNMLLPLGFTLKSAASGLTLKVNELSNFATGTKVYLVDSEQNTQTELLPETQYTFNNTASTTNNETRFSLLFRAPGTTTGVETTSKLNAQVFVNAANRITIIAPEKANFAIYNAVGMLIQNGQITAKLQTVNNKLNAGVYFVQLSVQGRNEIQKLIIR